MEVSRELEASEVWSEPERAQALGRERAALEAVVQGLDEVSTGLCDARDLLDMAAEETDQDAIDVVVKDIADFEKQVSDLEFRRMFSGETDPNNAFVDIQAGSGGTEAQDWAEMLLRMYLRWGERRGFETELLEASDGDVAGIKSATVRFAGDYAFGWLRTEFAVRIPAHGGGGPMSIRMLPASEQGSSHEGPAGKTV